MIGNGDDILEITVLDDGTIKVETDLISQANHANADALLAALREAAGGIVHVERKQARRQQTQQAKVGAKR